MPLSQGMAVSVLFRRTPTINSDDLVTKRMKTYPAVRRGNVHWEREASLPRPMTEIIRQSY